MVSGPWQRTADNSQSSKPTMPTIIRCPSCTRSLALPDDLAGQQVKCPSCETTFTAEAAPAEPPLPSRSPLPPLPEGAYGEEPVPPPGLPQAPPPSREERYGRWEDDDDYRVERRASQEEARRAVSAPATALQVVGWLLIAGGILVMVCGCVGLAGEMGRGRPNRNADAEAAMGMVIFAMMALAYLVLGMLIVMGASRMKRLESYGWGMAASILAIVSGGILGIAFGIWALVALNRPEVKRAFPGQYA